MDKTDFWSAAYGILLAILPVFCVLFYVHFDDGDGALFGVLGNAIYGVLLLTFLLLCGLLSALVSAPLIILVSFLENHSASTKKFFYKYKEEAGGIFFAIVLAVSMALWFGAASVIFGAFGYDRGIAIICSVDPACQGTTKGNF